MGNACAKGDADDRRKAPALPIPGDEETMKRGWEVASRIADQLVSLRRLQGLSNSDLPPDRPLETVLREFFDLLDKDHDHSIDQAEWQTIFSDLDWETFIQQRNSLVGLHDSNPALHRFTLEDWELMFVGASVYTQTSVERAGLLADKVANNLTNIEVQHAQVEALVQWGVAQEVAIIALRDAPKVNDSVSDAFEMILEIAGSTGISGLVGVSEAVAPEEGIALEHWVEVSANGVLDVHQSAGVEGDTWRTDSRTITKSLQLPLLSVGLESGGTRLEVEGAVLLDRRGAPIVPSPGTLWIEASSPESALLWHKALTYDVKYGADVPLPEDPGCEVLNSGFVWLTTVDMVACRRLLKYWFVLTEQTLSLLPTSCGEQLGVHYNDKKAHTLTTSLLDIGEMHEEGELHGPTRGLAGGMRLYDNESRRTLDLYHPQSQAMMALRESLLDQSEVLRISAEQDFRESIQKFSQQHGDGSLCNPGASGENDSMDVVLPPASTSKLARGVLRALLKFAKSTGQAFASGAFVVHDQFEGVDHALFNVLCRDLDVYPRVSKHVQNVNPSGSWFVKRPLLYGMDTGEIEYEVLPKTHSLSMEPFPVVKQSILFCKLVLNGRPVLYIKPTSKSRPERDQAPKRDSNREEEDDVSDEFHRKETIPTDLREWFLGECEHKQVALRVDAQRAAKAGVFAMVQLLSSAETPEAAEILVQLQKQVKESIMYKLESADVRNGIGWSKTQADDVAHRVWHVFDLDNKPENTFKFRIGQEVYVPYSVTADIMNGIQNNQNRMDAA